MPLTDPKKRIQYQEQSKLWADTFDGKEVIVFFVTHTNTWPQEPTQQNIIGVAKRVSHHFKWGRLRVYLNKDEYPRIVTNNNLQWHQKIVYTVEDRGLTVHQDFLINGDWFCDVLWSERDCIKLWEPYKRKYVIERLREVGAAC